MSHDHGSPITVIVVTWNSAKVLPGLLESLPMGMAGARWQLAIVDNGSSDETAALARAGPDEANVIDLDRNIGFGAAVNVGIARSKPAGDVLVLNPDIRLDAGAAAELQAKLTRSAGDPGAGSTRVGIAAPLLRAPDGELHPSIRHEPSIPRALSETLLGVSRAARRGWSETVLDPEAYSRSTDADWISGAALMISHQCLERCGGFDESFFLYSEDTEYSLRARDHGFTTVLDPEATAIHLGGNSRSDPRLWGLLVANKVALYRRRHGRARGAVFHLAAALRELRFAIGGNRPSWAALRVLLGRRRAVR